MPPSPGDPRPRPPLREAATHVACVLKDAGHEAYFAGGCVRDRLMGNEPTDYDVVTDARPDAIVGLFRRAHSVGEAFGVVLVRHHGHTIEVATFRTDGLYEDGRRPSSVTFSDARHDAERRDFTINGLFEDPFTGQIIDFVNGQADLEARVVRAIGDPHARLREDNLRMLRAVRFAARFRFDLEEGTAQAIVDGAASLEGVSRERIGQEIKKMLEDPNRAVAAWELQYLGLDAPVLGEPSLKVSPARLGGLPDRTAHATALAAWLLDRHARKRQEHDRIAQRWAERLVLSNAERADLRACLEVHEVLVSDWPRLAVAQQKRLAATPPFTEALGIVQTADRQTFVDIRLRVLELARTGGLNPAPLVDGTDLIALGLSPGPAFKQLLDAAFDAQLEGRVTTREEALKLVRTMLESDGSRARPRPGPEPPPPHRRRPS